MQFVIRRLLQSAVLVGCLGLMIPATALAQVGLSAFRVSDDGKFFSKDVLDKADGKIEAIKTNYNKDVLVETFAELPEAQKRKYEKVKDDKQKSTFWKEFAGSRYESRGVKGVYALISKEPRRIYIGVGENTKKKAFTEQDRQKAEKKLIASFGEGKFDEGLLNLLNDIDLAMNANIGKVKAGTTVAPAPKAKAEVSDIGGGMFSSIWGMVCIGLVVVLALWVVIGMVRGLMGGGRPVDRPPGNYAGGQGYGGGQGYAQPAGGGGGGGFFSSMLGGMFGAAAGMYVYDSFFRGHSTPSSNWGSSAYGSGPPTTPTDAGDGRMADGGGGSDWASGGTPNTNDGGGDWGAGGAGGAGGADAGGGGDWGAGGDAGGGGGGDWGGGGGDAGGGGDWGGGGGGDAGGGGGGDW